MLNTLIAPSYSCAFLSSFKYLSYLLNLSEAERVPIFPVWRVVLPTVDFLSRYQWIPRPA